MDSLFSVANNDDEVDDARQNEAEISDEALSSTSNLQSCDSGVSSISEILSCGSSEDSDNLAISENESQNPEQTTVRFLQTLLPWTLRSKVVSRPPVPKVIDKVGGTLALIQHQRPPNLPAKSPDEEQRHRKQYRAILDQVRKREIREESARLYEREQRLRREEKLAMDLNLWNRILPDFDSLRNTKKVRELWWRGLPPSIRGKIWKLGISNELDIKEEQYDRHLATIRANPVNESLTAIQLDVARTFPNLSVFQAGGPLYEALQSILAVYTFYRSDIGYVQGMSFIGAILALNMEPKDAFLCFANLLNNPCHRAAFTLNQKQMNVYYQVFANALQHTVPKVYSHFCAAGLSPDLYLLDWVYTIYAKAMPLDVTCRIWDVFVRDGDEFLFRTALGILRMYQGELLRMDFIRCAQFLTKLPENIQATVLFDNISQVNTNIGVHSFREMILQLS